MDHHQWRPHQFQANNNNTCPTCSISHFPFCPPPPHPSNFNPNYHPFSDPGYTNINPNLPLPGDFRNPNRDSYPIHNPGFGGNDYSNYNNNNDVFDRSSKRLRVDGPYDGSYGPGPRPGGGGEFLSRRLNVVDDHGGNSVRGYAKESFDFDRSSSGIGLRPTSNGSPGMGGYNVHYQRDGLDYQTGFGSQFDVKRGVSDGGYQGHDHQGGGAGHGYNNPTYGGSYGVNESGYGCNEPRHSSNGPVHYGSSYGRNESRHSSNGPVHYGSSYGVNESGYGGNEPRHINNGPVHYGSSYGSSESGYGGNESMHSNNGPVHYGSSYGANESGYGSNGPVHYDQRSNIPTLDHYSNNHPPVPPAMPQPGQLRYDYGSPRGFSDVRPPPSMQGYQVPAGNQNPPIRPHYGTPLMDYQGGYGNSVSENMSHSSHQGLHGFDVHPPLPPSPPPPPPPPLPMEPPPGPPVRWPAEHKPLPSPPRVSSSLFPVSVDSSTPVHSSHAPMSESHIRTPLLPIAQHGHTTRGDIQRDPQSSLRSHGNYLGDGRTYASKNSFIDKPKIVDAAHLFKPPNRASRPDHFVIILRGLPGSGKSYLAKMLRDLEVEHGGKAPRIHSMDDYFMTEVEVEDEASKSTTRVKKPTTKTVLEYCYEPEMEEAYRSSMLKAFKKTLEDGAFTFVIVDDRNLRVADFAQFWATAKRTGYEVYVLEAPYKDPAGCTARNVHGFTQVDVEKMAAQWENAPSMYLQVDVKSLFHGDDLKESNIEEVDMDTEDGGIDGTEKTITSCVGDLRHYELQKDETDFETEVGNPSEVVKDLGRSKWSNLDGDEDDKIEVLKGKAKVLSGLDATFGREGKSVHWGDQNGHTGFSIGAVKKANLASLVIGPGAGYNLKSNPLAEEDATTGKTGEMKKQRSVFQERLRAEQESFKAVFDRRRHRISVFDAAEDE